MKYMNIIKFVLMAAFFLFCGTISAQKEENLEKYIDKMVAKTKSSNKSYRHISVLGCNLGNPYWVFVQNLEKKGFKRIGPGGYEGELSGRDLVVLLNTCGKYILGVKLEFGCNRGEDCKNTYQSILDSLTKKYGKYTRKDRDILIWERADVLINLELEQYNWSYVSASSAVYIEYEDMIYKNWIKEGSKQIKEQELKQERNSFDANL